MSDNAGNADDAAAHQALQQLGLDGFLEHMGNLQQSMSKVAEGMDALGQSTSRQERDTENLAAHIIAMESVLTVILRHIPIDMADVRAEAEARSSNLESDADGGPSIVVQLAENIVRKAED